jgi:hypothetical protein
MDVWKGRNVKTKESEKAGQGTFIMKALPIGASLPKHI